MSFFKDFKEDLSQAVSELLPEEHTEGFEEVEMVDTITEKDSTNAESIFTEAPEEITMDKEEFSIEEPMEEEIIEEDIKIEEMVHEESAQEEVPQEELPIEAFPIETEQEFVEEYAILEEQIEKIHVEKEDKTMNKEQMSNLGDGPATDENSIITEGMTINGDITSKGSMDVVGCIIGNIELKGKLNISGVIHGNSKAAEIFADSAKITGEIVSEGPVKVGQSSVIVGNVTATSAVIAGAVKGDIDVHGPVILDTSAIVMGNIKSKSVQINNGAVIEGHCSQCYAEVSPTSFFSDIK
ncbi:MAG: polymer-forming cytoskeletal protein [Lachnospiraceae bacterium]|nr:polymer-forming cytoskeletal protein [Lachnospiraceae bacterium]